MNDAVLISADRLMRRFGPLVAVDDVSFELRRGDVLGFLGPNGAGKTTTMELLTGNLAPDSGEVRINGVGLADEPQRAKSLLGYLPERPPLYPELTVDDYLHLCARLHRVGKAARQRAVTRTKARCGLEDTGKRLLGNLSKGYQQRVGIAQAIVHTPDVVVLDEPTVGLDPIQIRHIRQLIAEIGADHSVILSTHILPEVQAVCSKVQIMHQGRLVFAEDLDTIHQRAAGSLILGLDETVAVSSLATIPGVTQVESLEDGRYRLAGTQLCANDIAQAVIARGWGLTEITPERHSLEQIFVRLTAVDEPDTTRDQQTAAEALP